MKRSLVLKSLRRPTALIAVGATLVVLLIWLLAYFIPQGHKLSTLDASQTSLRAQEGQLQAQLAQLKSDSAASPALLARQQQLTAAVPPEADVFTYIQQMSQLATASKVTISSLAPGTVTAPTAGSGTFSTIPVTVNATGTYDATLTFIRGLYSMPRLTVINSITMTGGGPGTNRGTPLTNTLALTIFTTQAPATAAAG